jgi:hypothetical protein
MPGYQNPGATTQYTDPLWHWNEAKKRWELRGSDGASDPSGDKSYTCVQYALAKVQGKAPDLSDPNQVSADEDNVVTRLQALGFARCDCERCGCKTGELSDCVVVYRSKTDQKVFHVAVFDKEHCDWGGKLSAGGPIAHFSKPSDYLDPSDTDSEFSCYCHQNQGAANTITDEQLNEQTTRPKRPRPPAGHLMGWGTAGAGILQSPPVRLIRWLVSLLVLALSVRVAVRWTRGRSRRSART